MKRYGKTLAIAVVAMLLMQSCVSVRHHHLRHYRKPHRISLVTQPSCEDMAMLKTTVLYEANE